VSYSRRSNRRLLLSLLLCYSSVCMRAQNGGMLGQSITWQQVRSPFTPDANSAIVGGPGADPNPGTPMYLCRAQVEGSLVPGKWVQGNCNVPFGGSERIMRSYEVAYGTARWGAYRGNSYGLAQVGRDSDILMPRPLHRRFRHRLRLSARKADFRRNLPHTVRRNRRCPGAAL
jgi:hypothetical protein